MKPKSKILLRTFVYLLTTVFIHQAFSRSPRTQYRHVVANGEYFFVMFTAEYEEKDGKIVESKPPIGTAFRVTDDGSFKKLWSVSGWYSFPENVFISSDGKTLVRVREEYLRKDGTIFEDKESGALVSIYRNGKGIAEYKAKELMTDLKKGLRYDGWGGYDWVDRKTLPPKIGPSELHYIDEITVGETTVSHHPEVFQVVTFEGFLILFDLKSGRMLTRQRMPKKDGETGNESAKNGKTEKTNSEQDGSASDEADR
jgi:hypothetical protein